MGEGDDGEKLGSLATIEEELGKLEPNDGGVESREER